MLHCPACTAELVNCKSTVASAEVMGWKCTFCGRLYSTEDLVKAIMTV